MQHNHRKWNPTLINELLSIQVDSELSPKQAKMLLTSRHKKMRKGRGKEKGLKGERMPDAIKKDPYWSFVWPYYTPEDDIKVRNCLPLQRCRPPAVFGGEPEDEAYWRFVWPYYTPSMEDFLFKEKCCECEKPSAERSSRRKRSLI